MVGVARDGVQVVSAAEMREAAAKIRDHVENKKPTPCNPTFMDGDGQWWQIRHWPELGLARHDTGPDSARSKVVRSRVWAHDLLPDTYPTLDELLAALDAASSPGDAP